MQADAIVCSQRNDFARGEKTASIFWRIFFVLVVIGLISVGAIPILSDTAPKSSHPDNIDPLVIRNVRIFDGSRILSDNTVLVQSGKITAVGTNIGMPDGANVIDGTGNTLLPGLIDAHTHVFGPVLKQAIVFGVTTELDMFTDYHFAAEMKRQQAAGEGLDRADLFSAGTLVTVPGGHGTQYGLTIPTINTPDEAPAFIDARIAEGSDYIKIVYDLRFPTLSKATLAAVIEAAHTRGKLAVVHISSLEGARDVIEAGADGLVHLFVDRSPDSEFGRFVAEHQAFVIPTLTALESSSGIPSGASLITDAHLSPYLSETDVINLKQASPVPPGVKLSYTAAEEALQQLKDAKVPIVAGTDAPSPGTAHGPSLHRELELLVQAGLTPMEVLAATTSVPATVFHLNDRGRIAPGLRADLLLVKGNPTTDIKATRDIVGVWKLGVPVDRQAYLAALDRAERQRKSGLVSDFEAGEPTANFGFGWTVSTDSFMGGKSTAGFKVVSGGARDSNGSLLISGEIAPGLPVAWAGAMFFPGPAPMAPVNLSSKQQITFWTKGDDKSYSIMLLAQSRGQMPAIQTFVAGPEWKQFIFPFSRFDGMDGHDLMGVLFAGSLVPGKFVFQIDDVRFE